MCNSVGSFVFCVLNDVCMSIVYGILCFVFVWLISSIGMSMIRLLSSIVIIVCYGDMFFWISLVVSMYDVMFIIILIYSVVKWYYFYVCCVGVVGVRLLLYRLLLCVVVLLGLVGFVV